MPLSSVFDTIVAAITPPGRGGVSLVRLSGPDSVSIARQVFRGLPNQVTPRHAYYGQFHYGDDGIAIAFEQGHSYTDESVVELGCHGSPASVELLISSCIRAGARLADAGEFTRRAYLNGRIDLTQAESVEAMIASRTPAQLKAVGRTLSGRLRHLVSEIREHFMAPLAAIEAWVDFSEELGDLDMSLLLSQVEQACQKLSRLAQFIRPARYIQDGFKVAIVGQPNVGKSSLLNSLLGQDRAIVSARAGTTRDTLEELTEIGGVPCRLTDTAGIREAGEEIEAEGIDRARRAMESADLVIILFDSTAGITAADQDLIDSCSSPPLVVGSKCDLAHAPTEHLHISTLTGARLTELSQAISERAQLPSSEPALYINQRQADLVLQANSCARNAAETMKSGQPIDLAVVHLRAGIDALGMVTGDHAHTDILAEIFSRFCVGK